MTTAERIPAPLTVLCFMLISAGSCLTFAAEPTAKEPSATELARWIHDLNDDDFQVRQRATEKLEKTGPRVYVALVGAMHAASLETRTRALGILGRAFRSTDTDRKEAAQKALEQLAKPESGTVAVRARAILRPFAPSARATEQQVAGTVVPRILGNGQRMLLVPVPGGLQLQGRIQIQAGIAGGMRAIKLPVGGNGTRTIEIQRNGKQIKIQEDARGRIKMSIAETVNGKPKIVHYDAKNAADLKRQHPEAYKIYLAERQSGPKIQTVPAPPPPTVK